MTSLQEKIDGARRLIASVLSHYQRPMVMSSFGKDSMVLLDIVKRAGVKLPVVFHREPFCPEKYAFANRVIQAEGYTVYDFPPRATSIIKNNGHLEIVSFYPAGGQKSSYLPTGIRRPEPDKAFLCGYRDLYQKPTGDFNFPWDVAFVGHKSSDCDPIFGAIPLRVDIKANDGACDYAYPLRHYTDADVWEYHQQFGVAFDERRYDPENGFRERADISTNPDYFHTCTACIDRDEPKSVFCPLLEHEISNISSEIHYLEPTPPPYIGIPVEAQANGK